MPTSVDLKQKRASVWASILDLRGKKDESGKFTDPLAEEAHRAAGAEFDRLTIAIQEAEKDEARENEMVQREFRERERTEQNTSTTFAPDETRVTHETAFKRWLVQNPDTPSLTPDEIRLLNARRSTEYRGTNPQVSDVVARGGYLVPESFANTVEDVMKWYGGIMDACTILEDSIGGTLRYPTGDDTGETGNIRTPQATASAVQDMTFGRVLFGDYTIDSGIVLLTEEFMQDERVNFTSGILAERLGTRIGRKVNSTLTNGTGTSEPYGFTTTVTASSTALTTAGATAITKAELIKALYKLDKAYMNNPKSGWMMHNTILGYLRTLDVGNTDTVQLLTPSLIAGEPDRMLGLPVYINNDLEAANATTGVPVTAKKHIFFGDFSKYVVRRVRGLSISRNDYLYWANREVGFMGWLRLDGNLINANAIKYITQA